MAAPEETAEALQDTDETRHNHLRVYGDFTTNLVSDAPIRKLGDSAEALTYDHILFFGTAWYDSSESHRLMIVIRESSEGLPKTYRGGRQVGADNYFIAITDGVKIAERLVADARWKIDPDYWINKKVPGPDELTIELASDPNEAYPLFDEAKIEIHRDGGTFCFVEEDEKGWLIGQDEYANTLRFLADPRARSGYNVTQ